MRRGIRIVCRVWLVSYRVELSCLRHPIAQTGGRTLRKLDEPPIEVWGLLLPAGGGRCGMLPGSERCSGGGEMVGFIRDECRQGMYVMIRDRS